MKKAAAGFSRLRRRSNAGPLREEGCIEEDSGSRRRMRGMKLGSFGGKKSDRWRLVGPQAFSRHFPGIFHILRLRTLSRLIPGLCSRRHKPWHYLDRIYYTPTTPICTSRTQYSDWKSLVTRGSAVVISTVHARKGKWSNREAWK